MVAAGGDAVTPSHDAGVESRYAWLRLITTVVISTIGGVGFWSVVVTLPTVQAEFGIDRADASLPYTVTALCIMAGGIAMGRAVDRFGITRPLSVAGLALGVGYVGSAFATGLASFTAAMAVCGLLGSAATFAPLVADVSHWFDRRRGIAVGIAASGNYLAGVFWSPVVQFGVDQVGWRTTHVAIGVLCVAAILPLSLVLRRRAPAHDVASAAAAADAAAAGLGMSPRLLQVLLALAAVLCCVAMSMPQVHIVAYCAGLGYGPARGAEMLAVMLATGMASRLASGAIADKIGAPRTLVLSSVLQMLTLLLYLPFDGLASLYLVSALFGLSQGGIIPSYAIIVRHYFPPHEAGMRVSLVISCSLAGMALGGWMSGWLFDVTGGYRAAFLNGALWNLVQIGIVLWILQAGRARLPARAVA
jgi:MFS family permease